MKTLRSTLGMSIIELLAAVTIVGLVATFAAPSMTKAYERMLFASHHREISSTLRLARSLAITHKRQYGVYFNENGKIISLFLDRDDLTNYNFGGADSIIRSDTLPPQFVWVGTDLLTDAIVYLPNGSAGFTGTSNVWTMATTGSTVTVQNTNVLAATGKVGSYAYYY